MLNFLTWIFRVALVVALVTLCVVNRDAMTLSFFPLPYEIILPKFLFALLFLSLGIVVGSSMNSLRLFSAKRAQKKQERRASAMEDELSGLRGETRQLK